MARRLRFVQLPIPQPAARTATGNVPLAAGCLATAVETARRESPGALDDLEIDVVPPADTDRLGDRALADHVARDEPAFVALSLYLWNVERSLYLARELKRRSPKTVVLAGGPEVSSDNSFLFENAGAIDVAVSGEAEESLVRLLHELSAGRPVEGLPNVRTPASGSFGPSTAPAFALDRFASPYDGPFLRVEPARPAYVETVRGCRSSCSFCFYPRSSASLRSLDADASAARVSRLRAAGARDVVFLDPTFNHRPGFVELLERLAAANAPDGSQERVGFFAEVRAEGLTREHAAGLARAGFTKLEIGLQSVNKEALRRSRRGGDPQRVADAAHLLRDHGIDLIVDLIIGLPGDGPDDVKRGVDFLVRHGLERAAQVFLLQVLPGTELSRTAAAEGIEYANAPPYRVRRTATFTADQLVESFLAAEDALGRRLDEAPRPLLDRRGSASPREVFALDLDAPGRESPALLAPLHGPGAAHASLWIRGKDLWSSRAAVIAAIERRLAVDPHSTLDVVLAPRGPFPLDLVDLVRRTLAAGPESYGTRHLAHRGENLLRRVTVVLERGVHLPADWVEAVSEPIPVFAETTGAEAARDAERLGDERPGAFVPRDAPPSAADWTRLAEAADPHAVVFEDAALEARFLAEVVHA